MSEKTTEMITLTVDGKHVTVPKGTTVYHAVKKLGIDLPIFCYQDRMPPFGACRVCMVEVEKMAKPQTSCTLEATEGMIVKTQSEKAVKSREEILEFLLINHPLDCPICDKGGECPLQDQTMKFGPGKSRFYEDKRRFKKPIELGPVLMLDRERCITCARCTRFGEIIAGDNALEFKDRGYRTEVGTPDGGPAQSKFIGNTILICPVGALTSRVYRFRARPWDNTVTDTTCTLCPVGCSMTLDSRDGEIMRTRSCENHDVNDIWLCDKGWFGYEFSYSSERLQYPLIKRQGRLEEASWDEAMGLITSKLIESRPHRKIAGLGGNALTVEENYLFQKLIREWGNSPHVDHRVGMPIIDGNLQSGMEISIGECESLSFAIIFGCDLTEEFPVIWLRLKQAINKGAKVHFYGHFSPEIAPHLSQVVVHPPGKEIDFIREASLSVTSFSSEGKKGAIFVGSQYLNSSQNRAIKEELTKLAKSNSTMSLNILDGKENSLGAQFAGMHPEFDSFGEKATQKGMNALEVLRAAAQDGWDLLYVAGANPAREYPTKLWKKARERTNFLVVHDLFLTETASQADVVLPTLGFVEKRGHFLNIERRIQKIHPGKKIPENIYSDAEIFHQLAERLNFSLKIDYHFAELLKRGGRIQFTQSEQEIEAQEKEIHRMNELSASFASILFDKGTRMKQNPHLSKLAKSPFVRIHPNEGIKRNIADGEQVKIKVDENAIFAKVSLDAGVAEGTVVLPLGFAELPVHDLADNLLNGLALEITKN